MMLGCDFCAPNMEPVVFLKKNMLKLGDAEYLARQTGMAVWQVDDAPIAFIYIYIIVILKYTYTDTTYYKLISLVYPPTSNSHK